MKKDLTLLWQHRETIFKTWKCPKLIVLLFFPHKTEGCLESCYLHPRHERWEKHPQLPKRRRFLQSVHLLLLCPTDFRPSSASFQSCKCDPKRAFYWQKKKDSYTEGRLPSLRTPMWEKKVVRIQAFYLTWSAGQSVMAVVTAACALHTQWVLQGTCSRAAIKGGGSWAQEAKNSSL